MVRYYTIEGYAYDAINDIIKKQTYNDVIRVKEQRKRNSRHQVQSFGRSSLSEECHV